MHLSRSIYIYIYCFLIYNTVFSAAIASSRPFPCFIRLTFSFRIPIVGKCCYNISVLGVCPSGRFLLGIYHSVDRYIRFIDAIIFQFTADFAFCDRRSRKYLYSQFGPTLCRIRYKKFLVPVLVTILRNYYRFKKPLFTAIVLL